MDLDREKLAIDNAVLDHGHSSDPGSEDDVNDAGVPRKYIGTETDKRDMYILGKKQVLRRNFKFVTMLGFASTVMVSWEVLLPLFSFVLIDGGTGDFFWGLIIVVCGFMLVYSSLAEMSSMCPTAGGQYHWVSEFAPPKYQKLLSYLVGWLCAIGWQVFLAGVCFQVGTVIQGLIALNVNDYVWHNWHGTLLTMAVVALSIAFNTVLATRLPVIEGIILVLHFLGLFAIIIPLWATADIADAHVLLEFSNNGGWPLTGISAMIGLSTPLSTLMGFDCSAHMSEEIEDASLTLPKTMVWSVFLNSILTSIMTLTLIFTLGDIDSILSTVTRQPFIQVFFNATQSYAATNVMAAIVIILIFCACFSEVATTSRQIWSFARDGGLPASNWLSQVTPGWNIPLHAVTVSIIVSSLLSLINIGSSTALNAINSLGGTSILTSYFITICCLVWRRLYGAPLPPRRWSLGRFGLYINVAALLFVIPVWFFQFWPLARPVTAANMNWASAMFGGLIIFALVYYVGWARHRYTGPVVQVKRDE